MQTPLQKKILRALEKEPHYHHRTYELRALIDGTYVYGCGKDAESCVRAFLVDLSQRILKIKTEERTPKKKEKPSTFDTFAIRWFEEVHESRVTPGTYQKDLGCYRKHLAPVFGQRTLTDITSGDCIRFFEAFKKKGIERTRENCDGIMRQIFNYAVDCEILHRNPMSSLKRVKKRRINGVPLSKDEEKKFLAAIAGTKFEPVFVLALYTGLRPCEYSSAKIEGDFIVARNRKQKDVTNIVWKKIPITPMLLPYVPILENAMRTDWKSLTPSHYLIDVFHEFCGNHSLKDLRTTFSTRCQECGVAEQVVQVWMGHSPRTLLGSTYTKFSDDYLLSEGKKVRY